MSSDANSAFTLRGVMFKFWNRSRTRAIAPAAIVGVSHNTDAVTAARLRSRDFMTPAPSDKYPEMAPLIGTEYGAADSFLEFLTQELRWRNRQLIR